MHVKQCTSQQRSAGKSVESKAPTPTLQKWCCTRLQRHDCSKPSTKLRGWPTFYKSVRLDKLRSVDLGFDGSALYILHNRITETCCQSYSFLGRLTTVSFLHLDMCVEFIPRHPISGRLSLRRFHDTNPCSRRILADLKTFILRRQS